MKYEWKILGLKGLKYEGGKDVSEKRGPVARSLNGERVCYYFDGQCWCLKIAALEWGINC